MDRGQCTVITLRPWLFQVPLPLTILKWLVATFVDFSNFRNSQTFLNSKNIFSFFNLKKIELFTFQIFYEFSEFKTLKNWFECFQFDKFLECFEFFKFVQFFRICWIFKISWMVGLRDASASFEKFQLLYIKLNYSTWFSIMLQIFSHTVLVIESRCTQCFSFFFSRTVTLFEDIFQFCTFFPEGP